MLYQLSYQAGRGWSQSLQHQRFVVLVPRALKTFIGIVPPLEREELSHPRVALFDLVAPRPPVIGQVITPCPPQEINTPTRWRSRGLALKAIFMV